MIICGLQKLSLLDFPGRLAATVFTCGCNFRCPFCHNSSLVLPGNEPETIPEEEFFSFLDKRRGMLDGVCITGGEPLLQPDIGDFLARIHEMGFLVKLDTNGSFPEKLQTLIESGSVDYVAMDIKNSPARYAETTGTKALDMEKIKKSIALLLENRVPYEFRTTLVKELHTPEDIRAAAEMISGAERYYLQTFVDSGSLISDGLHGLDREETEACLRETAGLVKLAEIRGQ